MTTDDDRAHDGTLRDTVVVGGGAAGLSAALTLARARRTVVVVDAGEPRNAPAHGVHGLLGLDGTPPAELVDRGRDEVARYGGEIIRGDVVDTRVASHGFDVLLGDGTTLRARTLLIATGVVDELPRIPGVREQWGAGVLHCPYCHGWEVRDRRLGVLATGPMSVHQATLFHQWSPHVVFFTRGRALDEQDRLNLEALGIPVVGGGVAEVVSGADGLAGVRLERDGTGENDDDELVALDAVVVSTRMTVELDAFSGIGLEAAEHPAGTVIEADDSGATRVPGVWAAGNCVDLAAQVGGAAAQGTRAAQHLNAALVLADLNRAIEARTGATLPDGARR